MMHERVNRKNVLKWLVNSSRVEREKEGIIQQGEKIIYTELEKK